jgi:putative DNA primase/helicase
LPRQLVPSGGLHEGFAKAALEEAAASCGLIRDDGLKAVRKLITDGLKRGKKQPRDLSEGRGAASAALRAPHNESRPRGGGADRMSLSLEKDQASPSFSPSSAPPPISPRFGKNQHETLADDGDEGPPDDTIGEETFRFCAGLDQSDVDNGKRLIAYFGRDLLVRQEDDVAAGQMLAWTGTHWDLAGGEALAHLIGQRVGDLIKQEADYIESTPAEARPMARGHWSIARAAASSTGWKPSAVTIAPTCSPPSSPASMIRRRRRANSASSWICFSPRRTNAAPFSNIPE